MENLEFKGRIEQIGKSLFFIITEIHSEREQSYPLVEVKPNASPCLMFGKWDLAISDGGLSEDMEITNPDEVERQLNNIRERIQDHFHVDCDCTETIHTKYFRTLNARMNKLAVVMTIGLYENSVDKLVNHDIVSFDTKNDFYKGIISMLDWGTKHRSYDRDPVLLLNGINHTGYDVVAAIGTMYEDWIYNRGHKIEDESTSMKIDQLLQEALAFQENSEEI